MIGIESGSRDSAADMDLDAAGAQDIEDQHFGITFPAPALVPPNWNRNQTVGTAWDRDCEFVKRISEGSGGP